MPHRRKWVRVRTLVVFARGAGVGADHRVEDREELSHASRECDLLGLAQCDEPVVEGGLLPFRVARRRQVDGDGQQLFRTDSRLDLLEASEAPQQEAGRREERQG